MPSFLCVWPHFNLITTVKNLFPNIVTSYKFVGGVWHNLTDKTPKDTIPYASRIAFYFVEVLVCSLLKGGHKYGCFRDEKS